MFRLLSRLLTKRNDFEEAQANFQNKLDSSLNIEVKGGHAVQSEGEQFVANRLWDRGIPYIYNELINVLGKWVRPDFILPYHNNLIIEFKGMNNPKYNEKFERKIALFHAAGMPFIAIKREDLYNFDNILSRFL